MSVQADATEPFGESLFRAEAAADPKIKDDFVVRASERD